MTFTVFKFAVSESADCSSPTEVFSNDNGIQKDMLTNPTFGAGHLKPSTYPCILIEVSKIISAAPATTDGACVRDVVRSDVICGDGQQSEKIGGTAVTCNASSTDAQRVTPFVMPLSHGSTGKRSIQKPISTSDTTSGIELTSPLVMSNDKAVTFVADHTKLFQPYFVGSQSGGGTSAPAFTFR